VFQIAKLFGKLKLATSSSSRFVFLTSVGSSFNTVDSVDKFRFSDTCIFSVEII
jgi:hypothetical protein